MNPCFPKEKAKIFFETKESKPKVDGTKISYTSTSYTLTMESCFGKNFFFPSPFCKIGIITGHGPLGPDQFQFI